MDVGWKDLWGCLEMGTKVFAQTHGCIMESAHVLCIEVSVYALYTMAFVYVLCTQVFAQILLVIGS